MWGSCFYMKKTEASQLQSTSAGASCIISDIQCSTLAFCSDVFTCTCTILCFLHHGEFSLIGEWPVHTMFWPPFAISNSNLGRKMLKF